MARQAVQQSPKEPAERAVRTEGSRTRPGEEGTTVESGCRVRPAKERASADKVGSRLEVAERADWLGGNRMRSDEGEGSVEIGCWADPEEVGATGDMVGSSCEEIGGRSLCRAA